MWNPLHSHLLRSKIKSSSFSSTSPFIYHFRCRYINKAPIIDGKAPNRMLHTHTVKVYSIQLRTGSIVSSNYVVLYLLEGPFCRSGISNLHISGKIGIIAAQSLLLHIIFAQVWYETGQWRKFSRFSWKSWWFGGYLNVSWRSVLDFERRQPRLPIILLNDKDIQLLHGKGIKRRLLVYPSDWAGRHICLVLVWEIIEANRYENPSFFCKSRWPSTSTKNQGL